MFGGRRQLLTAASAAALATALLVPNFASAGPVGGLVNQVTDRVGETIDGLTGGGGGGANPSPGQQGSPQPQAGLPPSYVPPAHGVNPHGQGTVGVVDVTPENTEPLPYDVDGGSEDLVLGRSRGEQDGGAYHGHITIASLAPLGIEIAEVGIDSNEGEEAHSPLDALNQNVLDALCDGSGNQICLGVLEADSVTTEDGSTNEFSTVNANVGGQISASVVESQGNIGDDGECQTSTGSSRVANANVVGITANAIDSESTSEACNDGSSDQDNQSSVVGLGGTGVPLPQAGCENGTPNTNFDVLLVLVSGVCNADDSDGGQADSPYGVREGLTAFVLPILGDVVKASTAASESQAVAPGEACPDPSNSDCPQPPDCPDPSNPDCPDGGDDGDGDDGGGTKGGADAGGPPGGPVEGPGDDDLPFTGADMLALLLIGGSVMGAGLLLMAAADRRRRQSD